MKRVYRNQHHKLLVVWFCLSIIAIVAVIVSIIPVIKINEIISVFSFLNTLIFLFYAKLNSVMLHKIIINDNHIEIIDYMPRYYIKLPGHQVVEIDQVKDVFWSEYDIRASLKTSRMRFNRKSFLYHYIRSKNPRVTGFLVLRMETGLNAYMRYFTCLSVDDQREILHYLLAKNSRIKLRFGNGILSFYGISTGD